MLINKLHKIDEAIERAEEFADKNKETIVNDFCKLIQDRHIGDLNLNQYTMFVFWKHEAKNELRDFYKKFLKDTKADDVNYEEFCEMMWHWIDEDIKDIPKEIEDIKDFLEENNMIGKA